MKKLLAVLVLLLVAAGYTACGGSGYSSSGPTAPTYMTPTPGSSPMPTPTPGGGY